MVPLDFTVTKVKSWELRLRACLELREWLGFTNRKCLSSISSRGLVR